MGAFFGGRAEARIVRTPVPVVYTDATSMYPLVNALLGTWRLLRAERLEEEDVTAQVRELLSEPDLLDRCLQRELWTQAGVTLVEIQPDNDILPARATYQPDDDQDLGIGVNPLTYHGTLWYALPDVTDHTADRDDRDQEDLCPRRHQAPLHADPRPATPARDDVRREHRPDRHRDRPPPR
jgi:hypothetical protein